MGDAAKRSDAKRDVQSRQRKWLMEIVRVTGDQPSKIASESGVSDTTLTRLLNNPDYRHTLTQVTIDRIKARYHVPGPEEYARQGRPGMIGFGEAERLDARQEPKNLISMIEALVAGRNGVDPWRLKTDALAEAGYLPGDIVIVDLNAEPQPQDVVCAQLYDWHRGRHETVFRVFDPPYLVGAAHDRTAFKPVLVDHERALIKGVVVESYRPHRLSATR